MTLSFSTSGVAVKDVQELIGQLDAHLVRVREAARENEFVDDALAEQLHRRLRAALETWYELADDQRQTLSEAVAYLVHTDDDEDDLYSPIGFDDDAEVVDKALARITQQRGETGSEHPTR